MRTRRFVTLAAVVSAVSALAIFSPPPHAQGLTGPGTALNITPEITQDQHHDVSPPLRDVAPVEPPAVRRAIPLLGFVLPAGQNPPTGLTQDMVLQQSIGQAFAGAIGLNFDGISADGVIPPDSTGAVGSSQFVQWANERLAVYSKTDGSLVYGPSYGAALYSGFGGLCEDSNTEADGIIRYDHFSGRWLISFLAYNYSSGIQFPVNHCIAVSQTSDATGQYNRYAYSFSDLPDYPKMGVWPNGPYADMYGGYYATYNMFTPGLSWIGARLCAYDRNAMMDGASAAQVCVQLGSYSPCPPFSFCGSFLPADEDGNPGPYQNEPEYMLNLGNQQQIGRILYNVDFTQSPPVVTTQQLSPLDTAYFLPACDSQAPKFNCVAQPGTGQTLDALSDRLMDRAAYRHFYTAGYEDIVLTHSVQGTYGQQDDYSGIRWYELRWSPFTDNPTIYQQGTFRPNTNYRWMGSIAMDGAGDIAVGFSLSSNLNHPSIFVTGRTPSDAPGTMEQDIAVIRGSGSQVGDQNADRWGDYSSMTVDSVDDCTFWYTNEYLPSNGEYDAWHTRIATFKFPGC